MAETYGIVTFDGGGVRGVFTARLLARLEEKAPGFLDRAQLLAGASTGGLIALLLASGYTAGEIVEFYLDYAPRIFDDSWLDNLRDLGKLTGAQYGNRNLKRVLRRYLGDRKLKDLERRVLIPAFDLDNEGARGRPRSWAAKFFHNYPGRGSDGGESAVDVAMRTAAAPTVFPTYQGYIDGGVAANNPCMAALAQTLRHTRTPIENICLFSLGTGHNPNYIRGQRLNWGYAQWARPIVSILLEANMGVADFECRQLLGSRYRRLSPVFDRNIRLDDWRRMKDLVRYAEEVKLTSTIRWLRRWFPVRSSNPTGATTGKNK